jgi:NADH-quinone oxidoreductase subunit J
MSIQDIFFYILAAVIVLSALRMVTSRSIFHSAAFLAVVLSLVGGLYLLMQAEFLAAVQILVYVGAVVILIIFAIMLTSQIGNLGQSQSNKLSLPAVAACLLFLAVLVPMLVKHPWDQPAVVGANPSTSSGLVAGATNIQNIGTALMTTFTFPFELVSLALLVALVGAIVIARKDPEA